MTDAARVDEFTAQYTCVPAVFQLPISTLKGWRAGFGPDASCGECWFIKSPVVLACDIYFFNFRQPPARLLAAICLNMSLSARALICSPWRTACTVWDRVQARKLLLNRLCACLG